MKKNTKNLLLATSCFCGAVVASAAFGAVQSNMVTAEVAGLSMMPGASIRMDVTKDENQQVTGFDTGIRFTATVAPELADLLVENSAYVDGAEMGMFIVPKQYIDAFEASEYTDYFTYFSEVKGKSKADIAYVCDAEALNLTEETKVNVSILKLLEKNYNLSYQAVAYYTQTVGETVKYTYTAPSDARTVSYVANAALLDTETEYSADQKTALSNIIEKSIQLKTDFAVTVNAGEWLDLQQEFTSEITAEDLNFSIKEGDCLTLKGGFMDTDVDDAGEAVVNVTAYDGLVDFDIAVTVNAREILDNEVIDFKLASDLQYADGKGESELEYVESFNGAQGVLKATAENWEHIGFKTLKPIGEYAGKYLVIRMWIETEATDGYVYIKDSTTGKSLTAIKTGRWVNYYFDGATFLEQWKDQGNYYSSLATNRAGTYYIDKIYMTDDIEVLTFDLKSDVSATQTQGDINSIEYVESFNGAQGVLKVDTKNWGRFSFKPNYDIAQYAGFKYLVMRMWVESDYNADSGNYLYIGRASGDDLRSYTTVKTGRWVNYYFNATHFTEQWAAGWSNYYSAIAFRYAGEYYVDEIYVTNEVEVIDFACAGDIASVKNKGDLNSMEYLETFNGAQGVLKVDAKSWGCLGFTPIMDLSKYQGNNRLVIRMYATVSSNFQIAQTNGVQFNGAIPANQWVEVSFDGAAFLSQWADSGSYYTALIFKSTGVFYIDAIYMENVAA